MTVVDSWKTSPRVTLGSIFASGVKWISTRNCG